MRYIYKLSALILILIFLGIGDIIKAQDKNYDEMTLEELLNVELSVASKKSLTARESPGIVTVISREEIINSGARDMVDVLSLVQGFVFVANVQGVVGTSLRGFDGQGGKILFMIDGMPMPEMFYGTLAFGNHYSVDQVKQVEIIRGPGSTVYGGFAELAVINVITKNSDDLQGGFTSVTYGQMSKSYARRNVNLQYGKSFGDLKFSVLGFWGQGVRSDRKYTDFYGQSYDMHKNSRLDPFNINAALDYKNLSVRFIADHYDVKQRDEFGSNLADPVHTTFTTYVADIKYDWKLGSNISFTPRFNFIQQTPWKEAVDTVLNTYAYHRVANRATMEITALYDHNKNLSVTAGSQVYRDVAEDKLGKFKNGEEKIRFSNVAAFGEALWKNKVIDVVIGSRFEHHNQAGNSFVPRAVLSKTMDRMHFKLLYSKAFRAPAIEESNLNASIKPERTTVIELEAGYKIGTDNYITANVFNQVIRDIILYKYIEATATETYSNSERTGTQGFEIDVISKKRWGYINGSYSYYQSFKNKIADFDVPGHRKTLLAFPTHKVVVNGSYRFLKSMVVSPSVIFHSNKYGFTGLDGNGKPLLKSYDPLFLASMSIKYENLFTSDLHLSVSLFDIFGSNQKYIIPHGGHGATPGPSREAVIKASYEF